MACPCSKSYVPRNAEGEAYPAISTEYGLHNPQEYTGCGPDDSCGSAGGLVPAPLVDGIPANEGVTILCRVGDVVSRFTKSGFIQLKKGKAFIVENLTLKINNLYHQRYHSLGKGLPVLGVPLDSNYDVIADETGELFGQKGLDTEASLKLWNPDIQKHTVIAASEFPKTHKGLLQPQSELELVGYAPIAVGLPPTTVRELSVLSGEGIIFFENQATIASDCVCEGCQPVEATASVAKFLPNPTDDGDYVLRYNSVNGHYWSEE